MTQQQNLATARWSICAHEHRPLGAPLNLDDVHEWPWMDATGPTDVLHLLHSTGRIPDPMLGFNDRECSWVEDVDWVFRIQFELDSRLTAPGTGIALVLNDVDCWATVYLNGVRIGVAENYFRDHRYQVDELLKDGTNELLVHIRSASKVNGALEGVHGVLPAGFDTARVHARRCQCWTGWDWATRLSGAGIHTAPLLERLAPVTLDAPFAYVREMAGVAPGDATAEYAVVVGNVDIISQRRGRGHLMAEIVDQDGAVLAEAEQNIRVNTGRTTCRLSVRLRNPRIWWPLAMGDRTFHEIRFSLTGEDNTSLAFSGRCAARFAVRTMEVSRKKDDEGESFVPMVNGHPVFCRGANWVPVSMLPSRVRDDDYRRLLHDAVAAGMNCLRVWGGGIYERDIFYRLCDDLGILVWQDFMFACAAYPVYREFLDEVELEAQHQIRRLRNHACVMLWCGNNENEWLHQIGELRKGLERKVIGEQIWSSLLHELCTELDPSRYYHQSSPFGRERSDYNDEATGDRHHWSVWGWWQPTAAYLRDRGRFLSEFGFQSFPPRESLEQFAPGASSLHDPALLNHQKVPDGQTRIIRYVADMMTLPPDLQGCSEASQLAQTQTRPRAVELWGRGLCPTAGTLVWQLNDAYPAISWALIDHYGRHKEAYRSARRFFAPLLLSVMLEQGGQPIGALPRNMIDPPPAAPPAVPVQSAPVLGDPDVSAAPWSNVSVAAQLINDTAWPFSGVIHLVLHGAGSDELARHALPVTVPPNGSVRAPVLTLQEVGVTHPAAQWVSASFEPGGDSQASLAALCGHMSTALATVAGAHGDAQQPGYDPAPGLHADLLLVESRDFAWPDSATIFGHARPSWHPPPCKDA